MPRLPGREKAMFEHRTEEAVQAYCRIVHPNQMNALKDIKCWDSYATRGIAEAEQMIETLKEYRKTLYNRAQQLESTPYTRVLELKRQVDYFSNKKFYYVTIRRVYNGNVARIDEMQEKYPL